MVQSDSGRFLWVVVARSALDNRMQFALFAIPAKFANSDLPLRQFRGVMCIRLCRFCRRLTTATEAAIPATLTQIVPSTALCLMSSWKAPLRKLEKPAYQDSQRVANAFHRGGEA